MQDCRTFADAFNYLLYGGKSIIDPEALRPLDTVIIGTPYSADGITAPVQKFRDELKSFTLMEEDRLQALVSKDDRFRSVEKNAVKVISTVTQSQLIFCDEEKEVFDVCKAIDDMRTEARAEGRNESKTEGMLEQARKTAYNLHDMGLPTDKIAGAVNVNIETVREWFVRRPGQIAT